MHNFFRTLAPELFDAKVEIHSDGSYAYSYDGILIFVPALIQAERATLDAGTEARLKEAAVQLHKEGFQRARLPRRRTLCGALATLSLQRQIVLLPVSRDACLQHQAAP